MRPPRLVWGSTPASRDASSRSFARKTKNLVGAIHDSVYQGLGSANPVRVSLFEAGGSRGHVTGGYESSVGFQREGPLRRRGLAPAVHLFRQVHEPFRRRAMEQQ